MVGGGEGDGTGVVAVAHEVRTREAEAGRRANVHHPVLISVCNLRAFSRMLYKHWGPTNSQKNAQTKMKKNSKAKLRLAA